MDQSKFFFNKTLNIDDPDRLGEGLFEISKSARIPYSGILKIAISYARQGFNVDEIVKRVKMDLGLIK